MILVLSTPPSRQTLTRRTSEGSKLYEDIKNIKRKFTALKNYLMVKISDLKTNYTRNSESNSKNENSLCKDQIIHSQKEEILFSREVKNNKNLIIKPPLENLELYNSQTEIRSNPCEETFIEPQRIAKKEKHLGKSSIDNHVSHIVIKF